MLQTLSIRRTMIMSAVTINPAVEEELTAVPARGHRILASTHCVERYFERRNDLLRRRDQADAMREARLFPGCSGAT